MLFTIQNKSKFKWGGLLRILWNKRQTNKYKFGGE